MTEVLKINPKNPEENLIKKAAEAIRNGKTVVFPTETVYGLGANALDPEAVRKIFAAKGRPQDNPLILHIADRKDVFLYAEEVPKIAEKLMKKFWPGPLTMIFKKSPEIPYEVTAGLETVAIRMPDSRIALGLIKEAGVPVAAPSANLSGRPSPTTFEHVIRDLCGRVDIIIDGGDCPVGVESTVIDMTKEVPVLLRPGGMTLEVLREALGEIKVLPSISEKDVPLSPGMKYKHYSPRAELVLVSGLPDKVVRKIAELTEEELKRGRKVGILATEESLHKYPKGHVLSVGRRSDLKGVASNLFKVLREFDKIGVDIIFSETFPESDLGLAIMNRLFKASGYKIINV